MDPIILPVIIMNQQGQAYCNYWQVFSALGWTVSPNILPREKVQFPREIPNHRRGADSPDKPAYT